MSDDARDLSGLEEAVGEHRGVRVWSVTGPSQHALVDRVAVLLGEHMDDGDELHVTYAVVQNGSQDRSRPRLFQEPETWTELYFEYSALLVGRWVLRRLVMLVVVAALLVGAVVWASHPGARHRVQAPVSRQLHRLERSARRDVMRVVRQEAGRVVRQHH